MGALLIPETEELLGILASTGLDFSLFERNDPLDVVQWALEQLPGTECPLQHKATPGLYTRTIAMPAGAWVVSKLHQTHHQYMITEGLVRVWTRETGWNELGAIFHGETLPGTRRLLRVMENTVWTTFHPLPDVGPDNMDLDWIERQLIKPHRIELQ